MKRLLLSTLLVGAVGCTSVSLPDANVPFACDPFLTDGGIQCSVGWSCGLDKRCFDRAVSTGATSWQCEDAGHCPTGWRCGVRISDAGFCQQLDAGFASPCLADLDCQGGWRCGGAERCFDPNPLLPDGTKRDIVPGECTTDSQCVDGWRCGQGPDGGARLCIEVAKAAPTFCFDDHGCEGGNRCDTARGVCVTVNDVVSPGPRTAFQPAQLSPTLSREPAPRLFAMSGLSPLLPWIFEKPALPQQAQAWFFAEVFDAGVRLGYYAPSRFAQPDNTTSQTLWYRDFSDSLGDAVEVVFDGRVLTARTTTDGLRVFVGSDAGLTELSVLPQEFRAPVRTLRGGSMDPGRPWEPWVTTPNGVFAVDFDAGVLVARRVLPAQVLVDAGPQQYLSDPIVETFFVNQGIYVLDERGRAYVKPLPPYGPNEWWSTEPASGPGPAPAPDLLPRLRHLSVVNWGLPATSFVLSAPLPDGGTGVSPYLQGHGAAFQLTSAPGAFLPACPDGGVALDVSAWAANQEVAPIARCALGTRAAVLLNVRSGPMGLSADFAQYPDDLVPYAREVVASTTNPLMRAHASSQGRLWFTDANNWSVAPTNLGGDPLLAAVLDRQPDAIAQLDFFGGVVAAVGPRIFRPQQNLGLVGMRDNNGFSVLGTVRDQPSWLMTTSGLLDLNSAGENHSPTLLAQVVGSTPLSSPATGFSRRVLIDGEPHTLVIIASGDTMWKADLTNVLTNPFASPGPVVPVFVPQPGVSLRSFMLLPGADGGSGLEGYLATATDLRSFTTDDLEQWSLSTVRAPEGSALPSALFKENEKGRVVTRDGKIWSLPIMVELSEPLRGADAGALSVVDFGSACGARFATTREGVFVLEANPDAGLPRWSPLSAVNATLDSFASLRLYPTGAGANEGLYVATASGQVVAISRADAGCP